MILQSYILAAWRHRLQLVHKIIFRDWFWEGIYTDIPPRRYAPGHDHVDADDNSTYRYDRSLAQRSYCLELVGFSTGLHGMERRAVPRQQLAYPRVVQLYLLFHSSCDDWRRRGRTLCCRDRTSGSCGDRMCFYCQITAGDDNEAGIVTTHQGHGPHQGQSASTKHRTKPDKSVHSQNFYKRWGNETCSVCNTQLAATSVDNVYTGFKCNSECCGQFTIVVLQAYDQAMHQGQNHWSKAKTNN